MMCNLHKFLASNGFISFRMELNLTMKNISHITLANEMITVTTNFREDFMIVMCICRYMNCKSSTHVSCVPPHIYDVLYDGKVQMMCGINFSFG